MTYFVVLHLFPTMLKRKALQNLALLAQGEGTKGLDHLTPLSRKDESLSPLRL